MTKIELLESGHTSYSNDKTLQVLCMKLTSFVVVSYSKIHVAIHYTTKRMQSQNTIKLQQPTNGKNVCQNVKTVMIQIPSLHHISHMVFLSDT